MKQKKIKNFEEEEKVYKVLKEKEIDIINKKYESIFYSLKSDKDKSLNEIELLNKKIKELSTFKVDEIGPVLAKLISWYECKEYFYQIAPYNVIEIHNEHYGSYICNNKCLINLITCKSMMQDKYSDTYVLETSPLPLSESYYHIILSLENNNFNNMHYKNKNITFYKNILNLEIFKKEYPYINDFVNYLIDYKIENNINSIDKNNLYHLLDLFKNNYEKKESIVKSKIKKLMN